MRSKKPNHCRFAAVLAAALIASSVQVQSEPLVDVWRSAFRPPESSGGQHSPEVELQVQLGATLFQDPRLSGDLKRACVSCHKPELAFTDGLPRALARPDSHVRLRNTPTLYNLGAARVFNWDGSATSLAQQALGPIQNVGELAGVFSDIITRFNSDATMIQAFAKAFPAAPEISKATITTALARYVARLRAPKTQFDAWVAGEDTALNGEQRLGLKLFVGKAGCVACHSGARLTDDAFHDIGLPDEHVVNDQDVAGKRGVRAFKTPTLRAVLKTAPYMHNGTFKTLTDVVNHYTDGIIRRRGVSGSLPPNLQLTGKEKAALVAFLKAL